MADILRSWQCKNARCARQFTAWEANPSCPDCQCVRVEWVPGGGHVGGSKGADKELRALADIFKMGDMNSAQEGRAAKKVSLPTASQAPVHTFAGGFAASIDPSRGAQCVPAANNIDFKVKAVPGSRLSPNGSFPGMSSHTAVEAVHKP